ncbi:MAG TPA: class I SAM-dependent rRNA methyltransferase [Polyangia bacterium]|nr:class I SAM-dependent rRNA methyltransferase [Polyangia bacterium]
MKSLPRVQLRKQLARAIRQGQPWIYRDALMGSPPLPDGALVLVADGDRRPLARGFWDAHSPIAVRVLGDAALDDVDAEIAARIDRALARRLDGLSLTDTNAFRWIHGEADALPGLHVDVYGPAVTVRYDGGGARAFYAGLPARLQQTARARGLTVAAVVERRPRGAGAEAAPVALGRLPEGELEVRENGLRFGADLRHGQKGGLFLDQRENRALVRTLAEGRRVLNLFGYTGAFSVYAAAGGARETTTVDVAAPAIEAAGRNFSRNGLPLEAARFAAEDAFAFLTRALQAGERWDLVLSDPPSFAANHRALATGLAAYRRLHRLCAGVTAPGGLLCAASCSSHVDRKAFATTIREGARDAGRQAEVREMRGAGFDHPTVPQFPEGDYLKFAIVGL